MNRLPRQVTDFTSRVAAAARQAEELILPAQTPENSVPREVVRGEMTSWVIRQLTARVATSDSARCSELPDIPDFARADHESWARAIGPFEALLGSPQLLEAARHCAEYMGATDNSLLRADYLAELFLGAYDSEQRKRRGVYYTPWPIVRYLIAGVDKLLQRHLDIPVGLAALATSAEHRPTVIDPSCGTGLFLRGVLQHVRMHGEGVREEGAGETSRVASRLRGFDVQPSAIEAARILLMPDIPDLELLKPILRCQSTLIESTDAIVDEARSVRSPLVILGNPPYANFGRANRDPWLLELMSSYTAGLRERKHNLHDDSLKFLRWSQYQVDRAGRGIVALVINHAFLDGLTHHALRCSLLKSFDQLYFYNLHGSRWRPHIQPTPERDENVFGIRCGITLCFLVKTGAAGTSSAVSYAEFMGSRQRKLQQLSTENIETTNWVPVHGRTTFTPYDGHTIESQNGPNKRPTEPNHAQSVATPARDSTVCAQVQVRDADIYWNWWGLDQIFAQYVSGIQTKQDALFTDRHAQVLAERMQAYAEARTNDCGSLFSNSDPFESEKLRPYLMAPFDLRWIYYEPRWLGRARYEVMRHLLEPNLALIFMRQSTNVGEYDHFLATSHLMSDRVFHSGHGAPYAAPLYLYRGGQRVGNFRDEFLTRVEKELGMSYQLDSDHGHGVFGARELMAYLYAIGWMPSYRQRFAMELPRGFPRMPVPSSGPDLFRRITALGEKLLGLHVELQPADGWRFVVANYSTASRRSESPHRPAASATSCTEFPVVSRPNDNWTQPDVRGWIASVPTQIREKRIGGVAVLPRWRKQRRDEPLGREEWDYVNRLVNVLAETMEIEEELEALADLAF